ncbi:MAG: MFS transporter [Planctomycetota bacterium]
MQHAETDGASPARPRLRAGSTVGIHAFVDMTQFVVIALMPTLTLRLDLSGSQVAALLAMTAVSSGLVQPITAWLGDRHDTRWFGTLGVVLAGACVGSLPFLTGFWDLLVVTTLGAIGVGAFHPPANAAVGALVPARRTFWLSLFFLSGMAGGVLGNVGAPQAVAAGGLGVVMLLAPVGVVMMLWLAWSINGVAHAERHEADGTRRRAGPGAWLAVWVLYAGNVVRFAVNNALFYLLIVSAEELTRERAGVEALTGALGEDASKLNGLFQGLMQVGSGGAALLLGLWLGHRREKTAIVVAPLLGAIAIWCMPLLPGATALALLSVAAGVGFGAVVPVTVSMAQRLLPHRTGLASGLMLGGAWMFAGVGALSAEAMHERAGVEVAFSVVAGVLAFAGVVSLLVPTKALRACER